MSDDRQAYTVVPCPVCIGFTALEMLPGRYVCAKCRGTGSLVHSDDPEHGNPNVADPAPDAELVALFEDALAHSASLYEFETLAKVYRPRPRLRSV